MSNDETTVRLSKRTKKIVEELGTLSDTFDSVILRMAEHYKKCKRLKRNGAP
ncbi:MAG TPA: hypothetical protein VJI12_03715 [archaeon]|nr:hypothetical protein [archaeon]